MSFESKSIFITGITGFLGSRLAERLQGDGHRVHALVRLSSQKTAEGISRHLYDGSTESLGEILKETKPDVVFHLASLFLARHKTEQVQGLIESNVLLGTQLLEATALQKVPFFINTGTVWQHYQDEDYNPVCLYAATKEAFEAILKYYTETGPLRALTLKLSDTFGPGDPRPKILRLLRNTAESGETLNMSPGEQKLDLLYVDDVVEAFLQAARLLFNGEVKADNSSFTALGGEELSLREIVALYEKVLGQTISVNWGGLPYREREVMAPWSGGETLPGWKAQIGLEEGLRKLENKSRETV